MPKITFYKTRYYVGFPYHIRLREEGKQDLILYFRNNKIDYTYYLGIWRCLSHEITNSNIAYIRDSLDKLGILPYA
jgi:hypothetical protein